MVHGVRFNLMDISWHDAPLMFSSIHMELHVRVSVFNSSDHRLTRPVLSEFAFAFPRSSEPPLLGQRTVAVFFVCMHSVNDEMAFNNLH